MKNNDMNSLNLKLVTTIQGLLRTLGSKQVELKLNMHYNTTHKYLLINPLYMLYVLLLRMKNKRLIWFTVIIMDKILH